MFCGFPILKERHLKPLKYRSMGTFSEVVVWYVSVGDWICGLWHFWKSKEFSQMGTGGVFLDGK